MLSRIDGLARIIFTLGLIALLGALVASISDQLSPSAEAERMKQILERAQ